MFRLALRLQKNAKPQALSACRINSDACERRAKKSGIVQIYATDLVFELMSRQFSHLLRLALPTAVSGRLMEDHPAKRRRIEEPEKASQTLVAKRRAAGCPARATTG